MNRADIALLTVEDEAFWAGLEPVAFGALPRLQDGVTVVGYPVGGDTMSVTSGVVSRIEVTPYAHGGAELLGVQVRGGWWWVGWVGWSGRIHSLFI